MLDALDQCCCMRDSETSVKVRMLKAASTQAEFIVAISVLSNFLAFTHTLSVSLQTVNIDLFDAVSNVSNVIALLRDECQNAETRFVDIWNNSKALAQCAQTNSEASTSQPSAASCIVQTRRPITMKNTIRELVIFRFLIL